MTARYQVKNPANTATQTAQTALLGTYATLGQTGNTPTPVLEGDLNSINHDYEEDGVRTYWYHPDHPSTCLRTSLGSSSYITNAEGIVTQHIGARVKKKSSGLFYRSCQLAALGMPYAQSLVIY